MTTLHDARLRLRTAPINRQTAARAGAMVASAEEAILHGQIGAGENLCCTDVCDVDLCDRVN